MPDKQFQYLPISGYQDPYAEARKRLDERVKAAEAATQNPPPMFTPEEQAQREQKFKQMLVQGQLGVFSGDKSLSAIGGPLLKRAIEARSPKYSDSGMFTESTGSFSFFPGVKQQKALEQALRQQALTENRSAAARSSYDLAAMRAVEMAQMRAMLEGMKGTQPQGSISHIGADIKGNPIYMHSKMGPFQYDEKGQPKAYRGPVTPRLAEPPAAMQEKYFANRANLGRIDLALSLAEQNPDALGWVASLPGAAAQRVPTKGGKEGVSVRAIVADLGSLKIHDRSGAAVTAAEFPRLKPFIPDVKWDNAQTIIAKLKNFKTEYEAVQREIEAGYPLSRVIQSSSSGVPGSIGSTGQIRPAPNAPGAPPQPVAIDPARARELESKYGVPPS